MSQYMTEGTVTVTSGSASVVGHGTPWSFFGVAGGQLLVPGYPPIPIRTDPAPTDTTLSLVWPWPHTTMVGTAYAIALVTADQVTGLQTNWLQSQILARNVGFAFDADETGSLGGRDAFDGETEGFVYGVLDDPENPVFYRKMSDASADWGGPFKWRGPPGGEGNPGAHGADGVFNAIFRDPGKPGDGEVVFEAVFTEQIVFPDDFAGSRASAVIAPTAEAVWTIRKNGASIGAITFAAASTTGVFTSSGPVTFAPGDRIAIVAPSPRDDTLSGVFGTLTGNHTS